MTTTPDVYSLSNLSAGQHINLSVAADADVLSAARAHLAESSLSESDQRGFFLSVFPSAHSVEGEDVDPA